MDQLKLDDVTLSWLRGGTVNLDGGGMFGVVPKSVWSRHYPVNEHNQIKLKTDPIYFELDGNKILIEAGIGKGKLNEKQKKIFGCTGEADLETSLGKLGTAPEEIDYVLLSHLHFDHGCGVSKKDGEKYVSTFTKSEIIVSEQEWAEMKNPNIRSRSSYWRENWEPIADQVKTFANRLEVVPGVSIIHSGGHSRGHSIITVERSQEKAIFMGDLMATHVHRPVLWVLAFDDHPMDSISAKEKWTGKWTNDKGWFIFYHDAIFRAVKWNQVGEIIEVVKNS